jgi:hypothetical protein
MNYGRVAGWTAGGKRYADSVVKYPEQQDERTI